jgi:hypothetical protein
MPELTDLSGLAGEVAGRARDAAYVTVGLGVLGLQRAQVRRRELTNRVGNVDERVATLRAGLQAGGQQLGEWFESTVQFLESSVEPLEDQLPPPVRALAGKAIEQLGAVGAHIRQLVGPLA